MHGKASIAAGLVLTGLTTGMAHAETLEDALAAAYSSNASLQAQRAQVRATDELVSQAHANWRPTVRLNADAGESRLSSNALPPTVPRDESLFARDGSLTITEPLYRGGRSDAQLAQSEAQVNAARQQLALTEESVLLAAVTAYLDVIQNQAVVDLNKNNEEVLQRQLDATNDRFRVGEVTRTDVAQAEAALSGAHAARRLAEGNLQGTIANYQRVIGHLPHAIEAVGVVPNLPGTLDEANSAASAANPAVLAQRYTVEAANHAVDIARGALLPQVSLQGSYTRSIEEAYQGIATSNAEALINVQIPLYQQGAEYSQVRQLEHTLGQQRLQLDETRRETVEATTRAWETLQSARARVLSLQDQVRASRVALEGVQRESLVGSRTVLDVLNAQQELLNDRVNLEQARHDAMLAAFQVKSEVGQLTAQALGLKTPVYDPAQHYNEIRDKWIGTEISPNYGGETK